MLRPVQVAALAVLLHAVLAGETKISEVTYGSVIKLVHVPTGHRLHSHEIPYGAGSGQQSVTAFHSSGDGNSYWLVKGPHDAPAIPGGTIVRCGQLIRLQHLRTATNLHSHDHRAPLSRDNEVSAYRVGSGEGLVSGDVSDNWRLECEGRSKDGDSWIRGKDVRLKHEESGRYLAADKNLMFNNPIPNQLQVSSNTRRNANTVWKTDEGFYLAPTDAKKQ